MVLIRHNKIQAQNIHKIPGLRNLDPISRTQIRNKRQTSYMSMLTY